MAHLYSSQQMLENPTVILNALCNSRAKIACCWSELIFKFLYAGSGIQNERQQFVWFIHHSFSNFSLHSTPMKKNLKELALETQTAVSQ
jgi:hypothetical protein